MMAILSYKSWHKRFKLINLTDWNKKDLKKNIWKRWGRKQNKNVIKKLIDSLWFRQSSLPNLPDNLAKMIPRKLNSNINEKTRKIGLLKVKIGQLRLPI